MTESVILDDISLVLQWKLEAYISSYLLLKSDKKDRALEILNALNKEKTKYLQFKDFPFDLNIQNDDTCQISNSCIEAIKCLICSLLHVVTHEKALLIIKTVFSVSVEYIVDNSGIFYYNTLYFNIPGIIKSVDLFYGENMVKKKCTNEKTKFYPQESETTLLEEVI